MPFLGNVLAAVMARVGSGRIQLKLLSLQSQLDFSPVQMSIEGMLPHTRAMVAAAAYAFVNGKTVAGLYDHSAERDLQIAAECRGDRLQGFDGNRGVKFGGTLPELHDAGDRTFVSMAIHGMEAQGHDQGSSSSYVAHVTEYLVQLYDYGESAWFTYDIRDAKSAQGYHRGVVARG